MKQEMYTERRPRSSASTVRGPGKSTSVSALAFLRPDWPGGSILRSSTGIELAQPSNANLMSNSHLLMRPERRGASINSMTGILL